MMETEDNLRIESGIGRTIARKACRLGRPGLRTDVAVADAGSRV